MTKNDALTKAEATAWLDPGLTGFARVCSAAAKRLAHPDSDVGKHYTVPLYAHAPPAVPVESLDTGNWADDPLYKALDALYERGWEDHPKKKYDPRGTKQWDAVLHLFRAFRDRSAVPVASVPDGRQAFIENRKARYIEFGMKAEQAQICAETDAEMVEIYANTPPTNQEGAAP